MKKKNSLKKVMHYVGRYRLSLVFTIVLAAIEVALTLYLPIIIGDGIDAIVGVGNVDLSLIAEISTRGLIIIALTAAAQWLMNIINNSISFNIVRDVRKEAFKKIQELPLSYLDSHPSGDIVSRVISDADQFADGLLIGFTQLFTGVLTILGTLGFMVVYNWKIALIVVFLTPLSLLVAKFVAEHTHSMFLLQSETRGEQTAYIEEMLDGQKVSKSFCHESDDLEKFDEINDRLSKYSLRTTFFSSITNPTTRFINNVVYAAVALVGALSVISAAESGDPELFSVGALSALLSYSNKYSKPFNEITGVITELQNAFACASRLFELIEETPQTPDPENARVLTHADGELELSNVRFSYDPEKELIKDFNLSVKPGQTVAIVGPTGCGKTTLINLLMRFYDVSDGSISVDGHDIRRYTRKSLRTNYGMVLQDTWLKSGTIRENITMGKPDATDEEIIAAAKAAHSHSFIKRLPNGYDTVIGEDGGMLSQGQKQLLCITRIMLCLPPMLILDEATSSIDTRTELKIQDAFAELMRGRTSFIVAHRLSTIRAADIILVMKDGNIIEQGNHQTLLERGGFYSELWNSQFKR